jgi:bacillithiol system protein YtxJ
MAQVTELASTQDADRMIQASYERPVYLLKHSISCPVSARGQMAFVGLADEADLDLYTVIVQYARSVSTYLAETLGVRHETPQAILVKDGEAVSVASHYAIKTNALREAALQANA